MLQQKQAGKAKVRLESSFSEGAYLLRQHCWFRTAFRVKLLVWRRGGHLSIGAIKMPVKTARSYLKMKKDV